MCIQKGFPQVPYPKVPFITLFTSTHDQNFFQRILASNDDIITTDFMVGQIPAFPGAGGFGSTTPGGRGGIVIAVTNLNPDGPGSLREALESSGPRIVVFQTGGTIELTENISILEPYVTVAGQTAPGDGILIKGAAIGIRTHDVIVRGLRIRVGDDPDGPNPVNRDGISISDASMPTYNIIIDHCSVSWAVDENIQLYYENHDVTIQWSIISEGLRYSLHPEGEHSNGLIIGSSGITERVSVHHNLFAHNLRRNPVISDGNTAEIINNVVYNWVIGTTIAGNGNVISNVYKASIETDCAKGIRFRDWENPETLGMLYVKDNIGPGRPTNTGDDWLIVDDEGVPPPSHRSFVPVAPLSNVQIDDVDDVFNLVLANAGAIIPHRDEVDERIVHDVIDGTGSLIDSQDEVGGWPLLDPGTPWPDTDNDGMDDTWELNTYGNLSMDADGDHDENGYTNIEEYINSLISFNEFDLGNPSIINVPSEYLTIEAALVAASDGDTILVAPGSYQETIKMPNKSLVLASWFLTTDDNNYISQTILDGNGNNTVITIPCYVTSLPTITGFTIQNAQDGILPQAKFNILNCRIVNCSDGIDYESRSGGLCKFNVFENNNDDGIDLDADVDIVIEDNIIRNNDDSGIEIRLHPYNGPLLNYIIRHNLIYDNHEDGIQLIDYDTLSDRFFLIEKNLIYNNDMSGIGCMGGAETSENYEGASILERIYLFNNTFVGNDYGVTGGDSLVGVNNIFIGHAGKAMKNVDGGSIVSYGLYWNNGTNFENCNVDNPSILLMDPLLDDQYHLSPTSPAIDTGTALFIWQGDIVLDLTSSGYSGMAPDLGAFEVIAEHVLVEVKVFLEGPYNASGDTMKTNLKANDFIPFTSPYTEDSRTVSAIPDSVTDWVLLQLRESATSTAVASKSAFLRNDGRTVADDGQNEQIIMNVSPGYYYIIIRHRNHLAVMSADSVQLGSLSSTLYDFTIGTDKYYGSDAKELEIGVYGMYGGDGNHDGFVNAIDENLVWRPDNGTSGYKDADFNLDIFVNAIDENLVWRVNNGKGTKVP